MTGRDAIGSDEELGWLSACDLRDQYATGSLSPVEVLEAVLGAIDAWDARLHAFVTVCDEAAHESARRAAAEMQKDAEWPETRPLLGIPVSIKDVIATAGIRTTMAEAHHSVRTFAESVNPLFDEFDVLVTPTLPITAFRAGLDQPGEVAGVATSYLDWTPFTYPFNVTGFPALSLPCGLAENGLPVGLQIVGPWRRDDLVLAVGRALAAALPWESRQPDHLATGFKGK